MTSRTRTLFALLAPALIAGGIVAASATSTRADEDDDARAAEREARAAEREARKAEQEARKEAAREAKKHMKEARQEVKEQLAEARRQLENAPLPDGMREKIDQRMGKAGSGDMSSFEAEMEAMGAEIEAEMEGMAEEFEDFGKGWEDWAKKFDGQDFDFDFDFDPHAAVPMPPVPPVPPVPPAAPSAGIPGVDLDLGDLDIVIDLPDLGLDADQVEQLQSIFESEQDVLEPAREELQELSDDLREALEDPGASEAEIGRMVDAISDREAKIRKAQVLAWVKSRKILDASQRDRVEDAKIRSRDRRGPRRVR